MTSNTLPKAILDAQPQLFSLQPLLMHEDPAVRQIGLRQAQDDLDEEATAIFAWACQDPDAAVRHEAASALEGTAKPDGVAALIGCLSDTSAAVRLAAARSLQEISANEAGDLLVDALENSDDSSVSAALLGALRKLCQPRALPGALKALADPAADTRRQAIGLIAYLRDPTALPALAQQVGDDSATVRVAAVAALGYADNAHTELLLPAFLDALNDSDWQVREAAATTLCKLRWPAATTALIHSLSHDTFWQVRLKACACLGLLQAQASIPGLIDCLNHPISNLRKEAASALGAIGDIAARPALEAALADSDVEVRKIAAHALLCLRIPQEQTHAT